MRNLAMIGLLLCAASAQPLYSSTGRSASTTAEPALVDGGIRHYVRSNRDGSQAENIVHFRPERGAVAVYKWSQKCESAAYVTARMDPQSWEPAVIDAGRVARDGSQNRFGQIVMDGASRRLSAKAQLPPGPVSDTADLPQGLPWFLFDYDLGDLNTFLQERRPTADFTFAFALLWPQSEDFLTYLATVRARHMGIEVRGDTPARRFDLLFEGPNQGDGTLWLDPHTGAIIEAQASLPNHPGMRDFRLKLERIEGGGSAAWNALLKGHYSTCPA